ncbi:hypothetical protein CXF74_06295 [Psychromonas sp. Urea-02u-13]|nr:hypothetical protein CXF74_06295 [Psychromonas sp. Urea-02u-13]
MPVSKLVIGENIVISSLAAYRLQLSLGEWDWGCLLFNKGAAPIHFKEAPGLVINDKALLIHGADIEDDFEKLLVYINIDNKKPNQTINAQLTELLSGSITASMQFSNDELPQSAFVLLELYRHKEQLKLRCIGQGFAQGISKLFASYGVTEASVHKEAMSSTSAKSVTVSNTQLDDILVNMHWDTKQSSVHHGANLFVGENFKPMTDLRVGCLYELHNGQRGLVQTIGEDLLGSFHGVPYVEALRSENSHVEQLAINAKYQHKLHRYLIYALMAEGHNNWSALNVEIEFQLAQSQKRCFSPDTLMMKPIYAVAMLEFEQGEITITALNEYFENLPELDQAYGWGLAWRYQNQSENEEQE